MKKHKPGFVPVNYKKAGVILLIIGLACLIINLFVSFIYLAYFSFGLILISLYLLFVVPKE